MNTLNHYDESARGLFGPNPYRTEIADVSRVVRTNGTHPERGIYSSELRGACELTTARLIRLVHAKRRTAYQQAVAFADAMNEQHADADLIRCIWHSNTVKVDDALGHMRILIATTQVPITQAIRLIAKMYQQVPECAEHMIRRTQ